MGIFDERLLRKALDKHGLKVVGALDDGEIPDFTISVPAEAGKVTIRWQTLDKTASFAKEISPVDAAAVLEAKQQEVDLG